MGKIKDLDSSLRELYPWYRGFQFHESGIILKSRGLGSFLVPLRPISEEDNILGQIQEWFSERETNPGC